MGALVRRIAKLEGSIREEDLVVILQRFGGGEYCKACGPGDSMIDRELGEAEEDFITRAADQLVAIAKAKLGSQAVYVVQLLRSGERALETGSQIRPTVNRDEWLQAHGLQPITGEAK